MNMMPFIPQECMATSDVFAGYEDQILVVKSHGSADGFAYCNAIKTAYYESKNNLIDSIREYTIRELNE